MKFRWTKFFNPDTILFALSIAFDIWAVVELIKASDCIYGRAMTLSLALFAGVMFSAWAFEGVQKHFNENI